MNPEARPQPGFFCMQHTLPEKIRILLKPDMVSGSGKEDEAHDFGFARRC